MTEVIAEPGGSRLYLPIQSVQGDRFAARLDVRGGTGPGIEIALALKGILTVMALGTALLVHEAAASLEHGLGGQEDAGLVPGARGQVIDAHQQLQLLERLMNPGVVGEARQWVGLHADERLDAPLVDPFHDVVEACVRGRVHGRGAQGVGPGEHREEPGLDR